MLIITYLALVFLKKLFYDRVEQVTPDSVGWRGAHLVVCLFHCFHYKLKHYTTITKKILYIYL